MSLFPPVSIRVLALRCFYWFALSVVLLAASGALLAKWWVLPQIDRWREPIAAYLSQAAGARVELGSIAGQWQGLHPRFTFNDVRVSDLRGADKPLTSGRAAGVQADDLQAAGARRAPETVGDLHIPHVVAELRWRSLLFGEPRFSYLAMRDMDIGVTLSQDDHLWVAGQAIDLTRAESPAQLADNAVLQWLRRQGQVSLEGATVHWRNEQRDAPELSFTQVSLALRNTGTRHQIMLAATPMNNLSGPVTLTADMEASLFHPQAAADDDEQGVIYADIENMQIERWRPWIDVSQWSGTLSARSWAYLSGGKIGDIRADIRARGLLWQTARGDQARGERVYATLTGAAGNLLPQGWKLPVARVAATDGLSATVNVDGLDVTLPTWFESPAWRADSSRAQVTLARNKEGGFSATLSEGHVQGDDVTAGIQGRWFSTASDPLGNLDLKVDFQRASLNAIHKYLPLTITGAVRHWLAQALVRGEVHAGKLEVSGPLHAFPYEGEDAGKGRFLVEGQLHDAVLDYLPDWRAQGHAAAWPRIEDLQGRFSIDRTALTIQGESGVARMQGQAGGIDVGPVLAHIPDMAHQATLLLDGQTGGPLSAYLDVLNRSALNAWLDGAFNGMAGSGAVSMPLTLNIPLTHSRDAAVRGEVKFDRATLQINPKLPAVTHIVGSVIFTRDQVRASDLRATWLGGNVRADGVVGAGGRRLTLAGRADMGALRQWDASGAALLKRITGQFDYRATVAQARRGGVDVEISSDLTGLNMALPAPFAKEAGQRMPLRAAWRAQGAPTGAGAFDLALGQATRIRVEQNSATGNGQPLIARAGIAIDRPLVMPDAGLRVDADLGRADSRPWRDLVRELQEASDASVRDAGSVDMADAAAASRPGAAVSHPGVAASRPGAASNLLGATDARGASPSSGTAGPKGAARSKAGARAPQAPLIGPQRDLRLQAQHLVVGRFVLDDVAVQAKRSLQGREQGWDAAIRSRQAQGRVNWRSAPGGEAGKVIARLSRLSLEPSDAPEDERERAGQELADRAVEDLSGIPGIDLAADEFSLYGRALGALSLLGTNVNDGAQWRLDRLQIRNPSADVTARGTWTARGEKRGLAAVTRIDVHDLGRLLGRLGSGDIVQAGRGTIDARITWANSPWTHRFRDIDGDLDVDLRKGRLSQVDSATVKLLELFSLQSLSRIATLKADPSGPLQSGFPFDEIKSHLRLDKGILRVDDYAIDSPVARIKLVGESSVDDRTWDIKATVIPKFDASGAALITGLVVNPVVGLGALAGQWLLKQPLEAAFTQRYRVSGHWDDPTIESIDANGQPQKSKGTAAQRRNAPVIEP